MKKEPKVFTTLSITREAQDIMLSNGYASSRTMGLFVSKLITEYHERRTHKLPEGLTAADIAWQLKRLTDLLIKITDG